MRSEAKTVDEYLKSLPTDRAGALSKVRKVILKNLPTGYVEVMNWGMITYEIPLETYADTYNKKPLMYAALASQKNYMAVYLCSIYCDEKLNKKFIQSFEKSGKKLDMGKSCVRFKKIDDLPLDLIGEMIAAISVKDYIEIEKKVHKK